MHCYKMQTVVL